MVVADAVHGMALPDLWHPEQPCRPDLHRLPAADGDDTVHWTGCTVIKCDIPICTAPATVEWAVPGQPKHRLCADHMRSFWSDVVGRYPGSNAAEASTFRCLKHTGPDR